MHIKLYKKFTLYIETIKHVWSYHNVIYNGDKMYMPTITNCYYLLLP